MSQSWRITASLFVLQRWSPCAHVRARALTRSRPAVKPLSACPPPWKRVIIWEMRRAGRQADLVCIARLSRLANIKARMAAQAGRHRTIAAFVGGETGSPGRESVKWLGKHAQQLDIIERRGPLNVCFRACVCVYASVLHLLLCAEIK